MSFDLFDLVGEVRWGGRGVLLETRLVSENPTALDTRFSLQDKESEGGERLKPVPELVRKF